MLSSTVAQTDAAYPESHLIQARDGYFYGNTYGGNVSGGQGSIYRMDMAGTVTILHNFIASDGLHPNIGMLEGLDGNFYGATGTGGAGGLNYGVVYKMTPAGAFTVLHSFQTGTSDATYPQHESGLVQTPDGTLWGTTGSGGAYNYGTVWKISPDGTGFAVVCNFNYTNGSSPMTTLLRGADGYLYGGTYSGGANNCGVLFRCDLGGNLTILHNLSSTEGKQVDGRLMQASDGLIYGTTTAGGVNNLGTVFSIATTGSFAFTKIHDFAGAADGQGPWTGPVQAPDGYIYGTTYVGGTNNCGTVYRMSPGGTNFTILHHFTSLEGLNHYGSLMVGSDGYLYGTAVYGGLYNAGTVYRLRYDGTVDVLHHFSTPVALTQLLVAPSLVSGGQGSTGTVTISFAAPTGGISVALSSSNASVASVPASVTVPAGQTAASFPITTTAVSTTTTVTLTATYNSVSKTAALTVQPPPGPPGGGGTNYQYQVVDQDVTNSVLVQNVRLTDIYLPKTMRVDWDPIFNIGSASYDVMRDTTTLVTGTNQLYWSDPFAFASGTAYQYKVRVHASTEDLGLPAPPMGADPTKIAHLRYTTTTPWTTIRVVPVITTATENQTADSRYDLRYSTYVFKDFQFKGATYRGGLFVGNVNDSARVGRSFVKHVFSSLPSGEKLWPPATLNGYFTRSVATGTTNVGAQTVSVLWNADPLKWTNAPSLTPGSAPNQVSVNYSGAGSSQWVHWSMPGDIFSSVLGDGLFSAGLASMNETGTGWAYFAKKEYDATLSPTVLYAYGNTNPAFTLQVTPLTVQGGTSCIGTVTINWPAPAGGVSISLGSDTPSVAQVPAVITIPAGVGSAKFTINASAVTSNKTVKITGTLYGKDQTVTITVTP